MGNNEDTVRLFWTGGWDSTYRLLQLLFLKKIVQTYYIIDPSRLSVRHELKAMQLIKQMIFKRYNETRGLLLPTVFYELDSIEPIFEIIKAYQNITKYTSIGSQYKWLAEFALEYRFMIELCVEKGVGRMNELLKPVLVKTETEGLSYYKVDDSLADKDIYALFGRFRFPVFGIDKHEMSEVALKENFIDLLEQTWFCHRPLSNGKPCGICTPCTQIMKENMRYRMPFISRCRYYFRFFISLKHIKKGFPWLYSKLKILKDAII